MTRLPHLALVAVLALGVAACSDDESTGSTAVPTPSSDTSSETTSETPETSEAPDPEPTESETVDPFEPSEPSETTEPTEPTEPEPTGDPDGLPTTYDEGVARFDAASPEYVQLERFRTPDDTYCVVRSESFVGCELGAGAGVPDPDYCGDGPSQNVGRVMISNDGVTPECNSDTVREPGANRLQVGQAGTSNLNGVRCLVEEIGVTCVDDLRSQGFFIGPDRYLVY